MSRKYNFCAGPSALPTDVLNDLKEEILDFQGYGLSTMEMSLCDPVQCGKQFLNDCSPEA